MIFTAVSFSISQNGANSEQYLAKYQRYLTLVVVFFAAKKDEERKQNHIVFLSLLSICFTIACLIINPEKRASASQHAWRGLDSCIIQQQLKKKIKY